MKSRARALRDKTLICGIDEAGRGPLAGPVYAACVHIPAENESLPFWSDVKDSKKLSAAKREVLFHQIQQHSVSGISFCSVGEIDQLNILQASLLAMERAFMNMIIARPLNNINALIDGNQKPKNMGCPCQTIVKGDSKHLEIAAASILAKVTRDRLMTQLHEEFPHYGWKNNVGYGSKQHLNALKLYGVTPYHRVSFAPVKSLLVA